MTDDIMNDIMKLALLDKTRNDDKMDVIHHELVNHIVGMINNIVGELDIEVSNEVLPGLLSTFHTNMNTLTDLVMMDVLEQVYPNWKEVNITNERVH